MFELKFENGRGYYLRLAALDLEDRALPASFINVVEGKGKKMVEFTTLELLKRNAKVESESPRSCSSLAYD